MVPKIYGFNMGQFIFILGHEIMFKLNIPL
jgi:hypothetical protein